MKKGERITERNIRVVRPAFGLHSKYFNKVIGLKIIKNVKSGTALKWELIRK